MDREARRRRRAREWHQSVGCRRGQGRCRHCAWGSGGPRPSRPRWPQRRPPGGSRCRTCCPRHRADLT
eukprot:7927910-Lingulodinium_polyedra.AAC.1